MERWNLNFVMVSLHLLSFILLTCNPAAGSTNLTMNSVQDVCSGIDCGQGVCKPAFLGFECECYPNWKKIQIGPLTFPACVIPNCTVNFQCGNGSPPPPPPPPPPAAPPPPFNIFDPCFLIWCGDGTCIPNGSTHTCDCNAGAANLLNKTEFACFQQCFFGADCPSIGFGPPPSPPPSSPASPGNGTYQLGFPGNGWKKVPNSSSRLWSATLVLSAAIFLTWL